jgi:hypothetical protein
VEALTISNSGRLIGTAAAINAHLAPTNNLRLKTSFGIRARVKPKIDTRP